MILYLVAALAFGDPVGRLPVRAPEAVGMSQDRLEVIDRLVREGIRAGGYPGASVFIGRQGAAVWRKGFGTLTWGFESPEVSTESTIYDLASLTKVVATTTAAMVLFDEGRLSLDAKVVSYLPEFVGRWKSDVTIRQLLTHRSGLPAGRNLSRAARTPAQAREAVLTTKLRFRPGRAYIYSDLGPDVLGFVIEAIAGVPLDVFVRDRVFIPLGMHDTFFAPPDSVRNRIAPTIGQGLVHDANAQALGGIAGHAGLFGTADDLAVFAQMMLNGGIYEGRRIVNESTVRLFTQRTAGSRALGWETADGRHGAGQYLSPSAFGHVGFTGTSLWIDPQRELFVILLTNRVHAARVKRPSTVIADIRADLADAAALAVTEEAHYVGLMPASFRADRAVNWNKPYRTRRSRSKKSPKRPTATAAKPVAAKGSATPAASKAKATTTKRATTLKAKPTGSKPASKPTASKTSGSAKPAAKKPAASAKSATPSKSRSGQ